MKIYLIAPNETKVTGDKLPFLGMLYIASELRKYDHEVKYIDAFALNLSEYDVFKIILCGTPRIVGICHTLTNEDYIVSLLKKLKEDSRTKAIITILGGPQTSAAYSELFKNNKELIDFAVLGEGEVTFKRLAEAIDCGNKHFAHIDGIAYVANDKVILNKKRKLLDRIDKIAFPSYDLIYDARNYSARSRTKQFMTINTSRGCNERCIYCHKSTFGYIIRFNSYKYVTELIRYLTKKRGTKELMFVEDNFAGDYNRAIKIAYSISANFKILIKFMTGLRINSLDKKLLIALKRAGCYHFLFGIESGDPIIRKNIKKRVNIRHTKEIIKMCRRIGIFTTAGVIIGIIGETRQSFWKTINLIKNLDPDYATFFWLTPLPGTKSFSLAKIEGNFTKNYPIDSHLGVNWVPYGWKEKEIRDLQKIAFNEFYSFRKRLLLGYKVITESGLYELKNRIRDYRAFF